MSDTDGRSELDYKLQVLRGPRAKACPLLHIKKKGDVGFDLVTVEETVIDPGAHLPPVEVNVDIRVRLPKGTSGMIVSRSGTYTKFPSLLLRSSPIDNGYTGPIDPRFQNLGTEKVIIPKGTALAQLVIYPAIVPEVVEVDELDETERGEARFGSTGE